MAEMDICSKLQKFCYVCGKFIIKSSRRKISDETKELYEQYFSQNVADVHWTPSIVCTTCVVNLNKWSKTGAAMPFGVPMFWIEPAGHDPAECYGCVNSMEGMNRRKSASQKYSCTTYAQLPLPHSSAVPVPTRQKSEEQTEPAISVLDSMETEETGNSMYEPSTVTASCTHIEINQTRLNNLIRSLKLSQRQSILLAKELKQANILAADVRIYRAINRQQRFTNFFSSIENNSLAYCTDIRALILTMQSEYTPEDWRLFIDASKSSLKAVLLHNTNSKHCIPIALSTNTKETYASLKTIIELVHYNDHKWKICADLKVVALLRGMQTGYTKNMCYMCLWNTRFAGDHYTERNWPLREEVTLRKHNTIEIPLVPINKILLPPLHIKLGIVKNFLKTLNSEGNAFNELRRIFPRLSGMKLKEEILNGPDIRRLMRDERFENALGDVELLAWRSVKDVIGNVLGIHRSENWRLLIENMLTAFHRISVRMSLKIHFLHAHVEKFAEQSPQESDEHGERFHQVTARLEHWYSGKKLHALLGDICWNLQEETDDTDVE